MSAHTMRIDPRQLATLVGSRLCHDLVSPIGAIGNGIELLELSDNFPGLTQTPEMRLIAESLTAAHNRLQAYRLAFGSGRCDQTVHSRDLKKLLDGLSSQRKLQIDLIAYGTFPQADARMIVLAVMCFEHAMPRGGRISVTSSPNGLRLTMEAEQIRHDPELWAWLDTDHMPQHPPAPSEVQFAMLAEIAAAKGRTIRWRMQDKSGVIAVHTQAMNAACPAP